MITKRFIEKLNETVTIEGQNLMIEFFITFSRFECALKASNFANVNNEKVNANWDAFVASIAATFNIEKSAGLKVAVEYLIQNPPRIQSLDNGQLSWRDRPFQKNVTPLTRLNLSIRDIRNNLFHGGKFNGNYQEDISRNFILLKNSIIILNEWLELSETVRNNYLQPIS
jgi:hypothetical protein